MLKSLLTENITLPTVAQPDSDTCETVKQRTRIVLSAEEAQGIHDILANAQPPTEELKHA